MMQMAKKKKKMVFFGGDTQALLTVTVSLGSMQPLQGCCEIVTRLFSCTAKSASTKTYIHSRCYRRRRNFPKAPGKHPENTTKVRCRGEKVSPWWPKKGLPPLDSYREAGAGQHTWALAQGEPELKAIQVAGR